MPEEDLVKRLVGELDKQTEPYAAWEGSRATVQKSTGSTRAQKKYLTDVYGSEVTDRVEEFAVDFYGGKKGDATHLAHTLREELRALGPQTYGQFRRHLEHGDIDEANVLAKRAAVGRYEAAGLEGTVERLTSLEPDKRIAAGKELAKRAGGDDYVLAATNPGQLAQILNQQKQAAENVKYRGPPGAGGGGGRG